MKDRIKPIFFTSDWHIGHQKCLEYDKRKFKDLDDMHESLVTRYNSTVPYNGVCYFLGDMGNKPKEIASVINRLQGTKVLIIGNHDRGPNTMYNCGFDVVLYSATIYLHNTRITLSHCPLKDVVREDTTGMRGHDPKNPEPWHGHNRKVHQMCTVTDEGQFHLHGHIHSRKGKDTSVKILDKQYDVGVCANNYTPVSYSTIESWIAKYGK